MEQPKEIPKVVTRQAINSLDRYFTGKTLSEIESKIQEIGLCKGSDVPMEGTNQKCTTWYGSDPYYRGIVLEKDGQFEFLLDIG